MRIQHINYTGKCVYTYTDTDTDPYTDACYVSFQLHMRTHVHTLHACILYTYMQIFCVYLLLEP